MDMIKKEKLFTTILLLMTFLFLTGFKSKNDSQNCIINIDNRQNIFLAGDSRTAAGYLYTTDSRVNWLCAAGTKYDYFSTSVVNILDSENLNGKTIVILYGLNDLLTCGEQLSEYNYLYFFNNKAQEWINKGATVKFCSVPPINYTFCDVTGSSFEYVDSVNASISGFNSFMEANLPKNIEFIHLYYSTPDPLYDGLHYSRQESCVLFDVLISGLLGF